MRIKSLELQGFKSFPDKTVVNFDTGVTIIVGPNGSGKSNISDAIRWVLGEISSKNIRGSKMEDVIFGGTDTRRQMGFAEVSITIDNTDRSNRMNIDYDIVTVTRRYYRTGDSEYFINAKPVRLKDIAELFMNTGIGRTGYSVIGQGKISEIVSKKSEDRRNIFEEAAGISKYRYKKKEAERKLDETNDNLVRVSDILAELESRVHPLEKEAAKARTYLDMYDEKKQADVSLWLYDIAAIRAEYEAVDGSYTVATKELEIIDDEIKALETQNDALYIETQSAKADRENVENKIKILTEKYHELESSGKVLENDIIHLTSQIGHSEADKLALEAKLASLADERTKNSEALSLRKEQLGILDNELKECSRKLDEIRAKIFEAGEVRDELDNKAREESDSAIEMRATLTSLSQTDTSADIESILALDKECKEHIELLSSRIDKALATINEFDERIKSTEAEINEKWSGTLARLENEQTDCTANRDKLTLKISTLEQRLQTLRRMAEHFDGYAHSVKFVMECAADGTLRGVHGTVSDIINTDPKYAVAIETALGNNIQNIVVDNESTTKRAIALLKENRAGRATFFPISEVTAPPLNVDTKTIESSKGFIGYADTLIERDSKYDEIVKSLLGRTVVFDNLDNAVLMEQKIGYKIKCVTLDGQIINTGGSFTGGSVKRESGILSRAAEMENLEGEIDTLKKDLASTEKRLNGISAEYKDIKNKMNDADSSMSLLRTIRNAEDTQMQVLVAQKESEEAQRANLALQIESHENAENLRRKEIESLETSIKEKEASIEAIALKVAEAKNRCDDLDISLNATIEEKNAILVKIASAEKDVYSAERELSVTDSNISSQKDEYNRVSAQLTLFNKELIDKRNLIKSNEQGQSTSSEEMTALAKTSEELRERISSLEEKANALRTKFMSRTHDRELKFRESANLENKRSHILARQEGMSAKIWDEYELSYNAATELGYPAVTKENRAEVAAKAQEFRNKMRSLGHVNVGAIEEYAAVKERYDFLSGQVNDLNTSRDDLTGIIRKLETEMKQKFAKSFDEINANFKIVFKELFGGGSADLYLTDPDNILESGIEINVAPPGKIIKNLQLLSGGEQVFVAIALLFAILKVTPTPFCLLDEIEAALDEVNVTKFAEYAKKFSRGTQFIIITHRRGTMEVADTLYGVTMQERGISRILSINVNEAEKKLGVKLN